MKRLKLRKSPVPLCGLAAALAIAAPKATRADAISVVCSPGAENITEGNTTDVNCTITTLVHGTKQPQITGFIAAARQLDAPEEDKIVVTPNPNGDTSKGGLPISGGCETKGGGYTFKVTPKGQPPDSCVEHVLLQTGDIAPLGANDPDSNDLSRWIVTISVSDSLDKNQLCSTCQQSFNKNVTDQPTPEPGSLLLFGSGLLGVGGIAWRRIRMQAAGAQCSRFGSSGLQPL